MGGALHLGFNPESGGLALVELAVQDRAEILRLHRAEVPDQGGRPGVGISKNTVKAAARSSVMPPNEDSRRRPFALNAWGSMVLPTNKCLLFVWKMSYSYGLLMVRLTR